MYVSFKKVEKQKRKERREGRKARFGTGTGGVVDVQVGDGGREGGGG
jgi:hypothetical protein